MNNFKGENMALRKTALAWAVIASLATYQVAFAADDVAVEEMGDVTYVEVDTTATPVAECNESTLAEDYTGDIDPNCVATIDGGFTDALSMSHSITVGSVETSAVVGDIAGNSFALGSDYFTKTASLYTTSLSVAAKNLTATVESTYPAGLSTHSVEITGKDTTTFTSALAGVHSTIDYTGYIESMWSDDTYGMAVYALDDGATRYVVGKDPSSPIVDMNGTLGFVGGKTTFASDETLTTEYNYVTSSTNSAMNTLKISTDGGDYHTTLDAKFLDNKYNSKVIYYYTPKPPEDSGIGMVIAGYNKGDIKVDLTSTTATMSTDIGIMYSVRTQTDLFNSPGITTVTLDGSTLFTTASANEVVEIKSFTNTITRTIEFGK
jgi:hypothetical protein